MIETNAIQLIEANFTRPVNGSDGVLMQSIDILQYLKQKKVVGRDALADLSPVKIGLALNQ